MSETPENPGHELERQHSPLAQPEPGAAAATEPGAQPGAGLAEHGLRARAGQPGLAASATRAPADATQTFDTAQGRLSYAELAERLAAPLLAIDVRQRRGEYAEKALNEALLLGLHAELSGALFPAEAGRYRQKPVQVGAHEPPPPNLVAQRMRDYIGNLSERMQHLSGEADDLLLEFLAYAEGELLSIHPFPDLNGRMSRLWLTEVLRRLRLPPVDVVPPSAEFRARYLAALGAADRRDWAPLMALWKERLSQPAAVNDIALTGCNPTPLASYLKALAVLRLVAEAGLDEGGDPQACGFWRDDVFVLRTRLTREQLCGFFLDWYRPTPLIAPWNGGSGFYFQEGKLKEKDPVTGKKLKTGVRDQETEATRTIGAIAQCTSPRFAGYRDAIAIARRLIAEFEIVEAPENTSTNNQKDNFIKASRNLALERCLSAMDSAVVITGDETSFPPLLGTGGNDGNLDFTNNFMQRLRQVIDVSAGTALPGAVEGLDSALFGASGNSLSGAAIGQFDPGAAGGPNASSGFEGDARTNAWDFILMLEGAVLFAASAARRMEFGDRAILSAPFVVRSRIGTEGAASARDDDDSRNEIWMPLWSVPCGLDEIRSLLNEGRATLNGRSARDGLDFARAVAKFGVNRGIRSFQRYGFLRRQGKNFLATPLSRIAVRRNPDADLITELERHNWLGLVQRYARDETAPNAFRSAARQLDAALFALTQQAGRAALQAVLRHIGRIDAALSISAKARDAVRTPAPRLSMAWAIKASDDSAEFRTAAALAGLMLRGADGYAALQTRRHLVAVSEAANKEGDRHWEPTSRLATWGAGPLANNLAALLHRRRLEAVAHGAEGEVLASQTGATRHDLAAFLNGGTDDARIAELLAGLACVDLRQFEAPHGKPDAVLPPAFALLKIFFTPESVLRALRWLPEDRSLRLPAEIPARLAGNDVYAAVKLAWQRLRALGVAMPGRDPPRAAVADGPRWLAALCIPLTFNETAHLLRELQLDPESATASQSHA